MQTQGSGLSSTWHALQREATLAANQLGTGATALGKANFTNDGDYYKAFFALSIGLERVGKLLFVVSHFIDNAGVFPTNQQLKNQLHHRLDAILTLADQNAATRWPTDSGTRIPATPIHVAIIKCLTEFSMGTRYYNLDLLTNPNAAANSKNPISLWMTEVIEPIAKLHYSKSSEAKHRQEAAVMKITMAGKAAVIGHTNELGEDVKDLEEFFFTLFRAKSVTPWCRMYTLQIVRGLTLALGAIGFEAMNTRSQDIPYFSEIFAKFNNEDRDLRKWPNWEK